MIEEISKKKFKEILAFIGYKIKDFFSLDAKLLPGFLISTALLILNILTGIFLPYHGTHTYIYSDIPYMWFLLIVEVLYIFLLCYRKKKSVSDTIIVVYSFFLLWECAYKFGWVHYDLLIPSPQGLIEVFPSKRAEILKDVFSSVKLIIWAVVLSIIFGTILGLLAGWIARVREVVLPVVNVITLIPPLMFAPYIIIFSKSFEFTAYCIIFFAVFWPTFQGMIARVGSIDKKIIEAAKTMNVGTVGMLFRVILPYCLPGIIQSVSRSLRGAFMCLSGAEMLGIGVGIGFFTEKYKAFSDYRVVLAGIFVVGIITTVIDIIVKKIEKAVIKWKY